MVPAAFLAATGLQALHYVVLLPPEDVVADRVRRRVGHGFRDDAAARRMLAEFVRAAPDRRHVVAERGDPERLVGVIRARLAAGTLRHPAV